jgi:hypothetical protein
MHLLHRLEYWVTYDEKANGLTIKDTGGLHSAGKRYARQKRGNCGGLPQAGR